MCKLYLLQQWESANWCENAGVIVRAISETAARALANQVCGVEGPIWIDPVLTSCRRIKEDGKVKVILVSNVGA